MSEGVVRSLGSGRFLDWRALDADGAAGGLLICWDKRLMEVVDWEEGQYSLSCRFKNVEDGTVWVFTGVYGPFTREAREGLWEELGAVRGIWDEPWAGRPSLARGEFTWSGGLNNQSWARLDRFLVSPSWLDKFSGAIQRRLPRPVSDHFPILLEGGGLRRGPSPFRFENMWLKVEGFLDLVRGWWREIEVRGTASYRLAAKTKELKQKLKVWNREVFGNLEDNKRAALQQVDHWDAPGPNGFTMAFWQSSWDFVKEEILEMFKEFHEQGSFLKSLNNTFLVLIPKKGERMTWNAFVMGRQILDASLIANEVIDSWQKRKEKGLICKLDIEKAYDSINWNFLLKTLHKMGFGPRWLGWMWSCISTAKFSVLVNGVPAGFFPSSKGLRQGDPLSPYLFVLGMEVLDALIRRAVVGGYLSGCSIKGDRRHNLKISHLFFADDTIVFCEANKEHLTHLSWILLWFEAASGLRINLDKSEIIPVGVVEEIEEMAVELGCRVGSLPSQYLGLPLGAPHKASSVWDGVEEKVRRRLARWKRQYISKGGRITLIRSVLASMPIYHMSLFRMPKSVAKRLDKVQEISYGEGGSEEKKAHLIKWEAICEDKSKGGLGLRKLVFLNKAPAWNATVEEMWDQNFGQGGWNLRFLRDFNDWEMEMIGNLLHVLRDFKPSMEEDSVLPTKVAFYAWEATWGGCSLLIDFRKEDGSFLTAVFYVVVKKKL
ncbi:LINE-1 reverse transcriptase-like [Vitis vinifera]|uniref:LINE-1 reverse transcriptase-like n=1 Tax=Vitis vinifera TaxID=29760 RepID=A0A438DPA4_VITVI|nr:LINE-1 reverse transcriptase-like [Vitis vinifera]